MYMPNTGDTVLTAEQELKLRKPIDEYVGSIQKKIDDLRLDGTDQVVLAMSNIESAKRDKSITADERSAQIAEQKALLDKAKAVEASHKEEISKLIVDAESYLKQHFSPDYLEPVKASCKAEKVIAKQEYEKRLAQLETEHAQTLSALTDSQEIKDEKYVYKNRQFDAKVTYEKELQRIKDRSHDAFSYEYHLIDQLRMSKFTLLETQKQKWENYKYSFNMRSFLLQNGLYIVILLVLSCSPAPIFPSDVW